MNRFVLGFIVGTAVGATAVYLVYHPLPGSLDTARQQVVGKVQYALESGKQAANAAEQRMWAEFQQRINQRTDHSRDLPPEW